MGLGGNLVPINGKLAIITKVTFLLNNVFFLQEKTIIGLKIYFKKNEVSLILQIGLGLERCAALPSTPCNVATTKNTKFTVFGTMCCPCNDAMGRGKITKKSFILEIFVLYLARIEMRSFVIFRNRVRFGTMCCPCNDAMGLGKKYEISLFFPLE